MLKKEVNYKTIKERKRSEREITEVWHIRYLFLHFFCFRPERRQYSARKSTKTESGKEKLEISFFCGFGIALKELMSDTQSPAKL